VDGRKKITGWQDGQDKRRKKVTAIGKPLVYNQWFAYFYPDHPAILFLFFDAAYSQRSLMEA